MGLVGKTFVWTDEEIEFLKRNYSITKNKDLAKKLNINVGSLSKKALSLGLEKDSFVRRPKFYNAIRNHLDPLTEINEEVNSLRKTVESINIQKENFIEKYFMVVGGGIIGGSVVYVASLNKLILIFKLGIILVLLLLGLFVIFIYEMLKKKWSKR